MTLVWCVQPDAHAQGVATFTYQRGALHIQREKPPALPAMPWQVENAPTAPAAPVVDIAVDIRPASSLTRQEGWMNLGTLAPLSGLLFIYENPEPVRITALDYFQPLDIFWIDSQGLITTIAPNVVLAGNHQGYSDSNPVKALLFMAGGSAAANHISPGDRVVESEYFVKPPEVLRISK